MARTRRAWCFPDYEFCFSGRVAVQNNGFAIRRGLPFACGPELADLSMNDDVRRGVELRLFPGTAAGDCACCRYT